jgi:structural maintenance of chromosome 2
VKEAQMEQHKQSFESLRVEHEHRLEEIRKAEELLQTLTTGLSAQEGQENSYMGQLQSKAYDLVNDMVDLIEYRCQE